MMDATIPSIFSTDFSLSVLMFPAGSCRITTLPLNPWPNGTIVIDRVFL